MSIVSQGVLGVLLVAGIAFVMFDRIPWCERVGWLLTSLAGFYLGVVLVAEIPSRLAIADTGTFWIGAGLLWLASLPGLLPLLLWTKTKRTAVRKPSNQGSA